jgi:hypothetical protein
MVSVLNCVDRSFMRSVSHHIDDYCYIDRIVAIDVDRSI